MARRHGTKLPSSPAGFPKVGMPGADIQDFPPRQKPASFNIDAVLQKMTSPQGSN